jgi:hypothetical protein
MQWERDKVKSQGYRKQKSHKYWYWRWNVHSFSINRSNIWSRMSVCLFFMHLVPVRARGSWKYYFMNLKGKGVAQRWRIRISDLTTQLCIKKKCLMITKPGRGELRESWRLIILGGGYNNAEIRISVSCNSYSLISKNKLVYFFFEKRQFYFETFRSQLFGLMQQKVKIIISLNLKTTGWNLYRLFWVSYRPTHTQNMKTNGVRQLRSFFINEYSSTLLTEDYTVQFSFDIKPTSYVFDVFLEDVRTSQPIKKLYWSHLTLLDVLFSLLNAQINMFRHLHLALCSNAVRHLCQCVNRSKQLWHGRLRV